MKTLTFFNNKGGVGKTSLVYHLAWMFAELGQNVLAVDLDPQSNLTSAFLPEEDVEKIWEAAPPGTVLSSLRPLMEKLGDLADPPIHPISRGLWLLAGDLGLTEFEDRLGDGWRFALDDKPVDRADGLRVSSAFYRMVARAAKRLGASIVLIDVGPNLGALNRAALVATDFVVVPLAADLFSLHGLRNLGPTLRAWRAGWKKRLELAPVSNIAPLPSGSMQPIGYVVMQPTIRERYPVAAYRRWIDRIPSEYARHMLDTSTKIAGANLGTLKNYRSLSPLAQDARKPMFALRAADGAIGGHATAVQNCYEDFVNLATQIAKQIGMKLPARQP